jgi:protein phosphatase
MEPEEKLLICSDGLWGVLEQRRMESILENHPDLDEAATMLVAAANEAGGPDNISVILVEKL